MWCCCPTFPRGAFQAFSVSSAERLLLLQREIFPAPRQRGGIVGKGLRQDTAQDLSDPIPKGCSGARTLRWVPVPTPCSNGATNAPGNPDLDSHGKPDLNWLFFPTGSGLGVWQTPSFLQRTQPKPETDAPPRVLHWDMIRDNEQVLLITEERK